jgi:hypothetical protein
VLYLQQARVAQAEAHWQAAVQQRADFLPAWLGLGECCLRNGDASTVEAVAGRMEELPDGPVEAAVLRGRWRLSRGDFAGARAVLEEACARFPEAAAPRAVLNHIMSRTTTT